MVQAQSAVTCDLLGGISRRLLLTQIQGIARGARDDNPTGSSRLRTVSCSPGCGQEKGQDTVPYAKKKEELARDSPVDPMKGTMSRIFSTLFIQAFPKTFISF